MSVKGDQTLVYLPVGPRVAERHVFDTVESFLAFARSDTPLVLLDDSGGRVSRAAVPRDARIIWRDLPPPPPARGGYSTRGVFWLRQAAAIDALLRDFDFAQLLRIDDDSLFVRSGFEERAAARFESDPLGGLLGQHRLMPDGTPVSNRWPAEQFRRESSPFSPPLRPRGWLTRWRLARSLRRQARLARLGSPDWAPGEHATGGGCFIHARCLRAMAARKLLPCPDVAASHLCDDHLLSLDVQASGHRILDCAGPDGIVAYRLDRLPADYDTIHRAPWAILHSVRRHGEHDEDQVRGELRRRTRKHAP